MKLHKNLFLAPLCIRRSHPRGPAPIPRDGNTLPCYTERPDCTLADIAVWHGLSVTLSRSLLPWVDTDLHEWKVTFEKQGRFCLCALAFKGFVYMGAAHCSAEDTFDLYKGMQLALRRALALASSCDDWMQQQAKTYLDLTTEEANR